MSDQRLSAAPTPGLANPTPWRGHIPALDGLRGVAILMVMFLHFQLDSPDTPLGRAYVYVVESGWAGVDLFFVLSGFLITGILYDSRSDEGYFRSFYARRALRIFPLYFGFLALRFFVAPWLFQPDWVDLHSPAAQQAWGWLYMTNLQIVLLGPGSEAPFTTHFWSLAIEEQFYLVWPAVVLLLPRRRLILLCCAMIVAALAVRLVVVYGVGALFWAYFFTPARMDALAMGALIALVVRSPGGWEALLRWRSPVLVLSAGALVGLHFWRGLGSRDEVILTVGLTVVGFFFAGVLVTAVGAEPGSRLQRAFANPVLRFFGHYSYSMYVFHLVVHRVLQRSFVDRGPVDVLGVPVPAQAVFMTAAFAITIVLSMASWHLFEKHFLGLKDRFPYGRKQPRDAPVAIGAPAVRLAGGGD
ncbi:MAG TPA: acyltransferase [Longimicrobiaceae bacterium]|nr:acyltransferase [Longimicrobiaceae bacterium]